MTSPVVKLDGAKVSACLTCLLCNKWFRNATTISECLHTFCRECIDKKLIDEKLNHCPVCYTDLGCSPLDKLRPDRCLQDLRERIVPVPCATKALDNVPLIKLRNKRKKKFLSSLRAGSRIAKATSGKVFFTKKSDFSAAKPRKVKNAMKCQNHRGVEVLQEVARIASARRAKAAARIKFIRTVQAPIRQLDKVTGEEKEDEDHPRVEASNGTLKFRIQNSSKPNSSLQVVANKISRDNAELKNEKSDKLESLKCLAVEATSESESLNKSTMQENEVTPMLVNSSDDDLQMHNVEINKHCHTINTPDEQNVSTNSKSDSVKRQRLHSTQEKPPQICEDLNFPAEPEIDSICESNKECGPIWFCLIAAEENRASAALPQISSCYIRVKDGSATVSYIKKYIVKKLGLNSENEVEITLRGHPLFSSLQLKNLVEMWLQTVPTNEIETSVGNSAKDYIMVLSYGRKA